jgi:hypothetical protein
MSNTSKGREGSRNSTSRGQRMGGSISRRRLRKDLRRTTHPNNLREEVSTRDPIKGKKERGDRCISTPKEERDHHSEREGMETSKGQEQG